MNTINILQTRQIFNGEKLRILHCIGLHKIKKSICSQLVHHDWRTNLYSCEIMPYINRTAKVVFDFQQRKNKIETKNNKTSKRVYICVFLEYIGQINTAHCTFVNKQQLQLVIKMLLRAHYNVKMSIFFLLSYLIVIVNKQAYVSLKQNILENKYIKKSSSLDNIHHIFKRDSTKIYYMML